MLVWCCACCKYVFSIVLFFPLFWGGGGGIEARAWVHLQKRSEKHTEYFVIVQSKGDTICIYLYCIYVHWLFVWHYLLPVLWLNIVLMFMYFNLCFLFALSVIPCIFLFFLCYCTVYYFCCPTKWHSYSLYQFSAVT